MEGMIAINVRKTNKCIEDFLGSILLSFTFSYDKNIY